MDPLIGVLPTLRIQPLTAYQSSGQQQRPPFPFSQGQLLQGTVSAKNGMHQFTIALGGYEVLADSTTPLQIGQKLSLQVASLTPQIELQIVSDQMVANRMVGNLIHLIGQQASPFSALTELTTQTNQLPQLLSSSRDTLDFYANNTVASSIIPSLVATSSAPNVVEQLLGAALDIFTTAKTEQIPTAGFEKISSLLQQLATNPTNSPNVAAQLAELATTFATIASGTQPAANAMTSFDNMRIFLPVAAESAVNALNGMRELFHDNPQIQMLINQLIPVLQENPDPLTSPPLLQLLNILAIATNNSSTLPPAQIEGKQLQQMVDRLGINMENLLARGNQEEAVQTLKFALLDVSQQSSSSQKSILHAEQLAKTIELFQLLQLRLSNESIGIIPLPFAFLNQGYLLVDKDRSGQSSTQDDRQTGESPQRFELHLQLEGLGNLQIDIRQNDGNVALRFLAQDSERAKFMASFRAELENWLTSAHLESAQFLAGSQEPVKVLLEKIMHGTSGIVDTKA